MAIVAGYSLILQWSFQCCHQIPLASLLTSYWGGLLRNCLDVFLPFCLVSLLLASFLGLYLPFTIPFEFSLILLSILNGGVSF
jgi:hypothetical protein